MKVIWRFILKQPFMDWPLRLGTLIRKEQFRVLMPDWKD
jgi:hypothetical protein